MAVHAQGVGQALLEAAVYDKGTGQLMSCSYMDYTMPRAETSRRSSSAYKVTPCPHNPLGVRAAAKRARIASPAAVMNAVHNALAAGRRQARGNAPPRPLNGWQSIQGASTRRPSKPEEIEMYDSLIIAEVAR